MSPSKGFGPIVCAAVLLLAAPAKAQQGRPEGPPPQAGAPENQGPPTIDMGLRFELEPKAVELLKAMSERLASARTMSFTAAAAYESMARTGLPLIYTTVSHVALRRPDHLRVVTPGDGPPSEFYYDGKSMVAFSPKENLAAIADAPPSIDAMLEAAFKSAAIYFPFSDVLVSDPYGDVADKLKLAFVVGQSMVIGGTTTDIVVVVTNEMQVQIWIGAQDRLPRMMRAVFFDEPAQYRHVVEFSDWRLNEPVPDDAFRSAAAAQAQPMKFEPPHAKLNGPGNGGENKP
jgi:hypothetical protein